MTPLLVLGLAATVLSLISPVLQLRHLARVRTTAGLNFTALVMGSCLAGVWFLYGLSRSDTALAVTYGLSLCLAIAVIVLVHRYAGRSPGKPLVVVGFVLVLLHLATDAFGAPVISIAAVVVTVIRPGMQAATTIMSKDIRGISGSAYSLSSASCTLWFLYGLVQSDAVTAWTSAWCAACYMVVVAGVVRSSSDSSSATEITVPSGPPVKYVRPHRGRFLAPGEPSDNVDSQRQPAVAARQGAGYV